jgi:hypothetical protein
MAGAAMTSKAYPSYTLVQRADLPFRKREKVLSTLIASALFSRALGADSTARRRRGIVGRGVGLRKQRALFSADMSRGRSIEADAGAAQ